MSSQPKWKSNAHVFVVAIALVTASSIPAFAQAPLRDRGEDDTDAEDETRERYGIAALPVLAYFPEAGVVAGAFASPWFRFEDTAHPEEDPPSRVQIVAGYTSRGQYGLDIKPQLYFDQQRFRIDAQFQFLDHEVEFYGIGNDITGRSESFHNRSFGVETEAAMQLLPGMYLGVLQQMHFTDVDGIVPDGMLETEPVSGRNGSRTSGFGASLAWDNRDNPVAARRGSYAKLTVLTYHALFGSEHDYALAKLDVRHFISTFRRQVLALRGYAEVRSGDVPFDRLGQLGGASLLRGNYRGRYRDEHVMALEAEYRLPVFWRFGLVAFGGVGQVQSNLAKISVADTRPSGGAGLRFMLDEDQRLNARVDVGFTPNETNVYLSVGEAF